MLTHQEFLVRADSFELLARQEFGLRSDYLRVVDRRNSLELNQLPPVIRKSAVFLEVLHSSAVLHEVMAEQGIATYADAGRQAVQLVEVVSERTRLHLLSLLKEASSTLEYPTREANQALEAEVLSIPAVVRVVRSVVDACPIEELKASNERLNLEVIRHRCRVAYDALQAFVRRHDPKQKAQLQVVGRHYGDGALSLTEAATLLEMHAVDAIALLEESGYGRSPEAIALTETDRSHAYSAIRADRLERKGTFVPSRDEVSRDAIANSRIEGVDVRSWIPREA